MTAAVSLVLALLVLAATGAVAARLLLLLSGRSDVRLRGLCLQRFQVDRYPDTVH